ncbi:MAG: hypothetical protein IJJ85_04995 [Clostridia bacterium]|nr:hypothetical protein [Clostridia bacterium]
MTDSKTLAYINMYAVLGTLENLCELDEEARGLLKNKKMISIGLDVAGGPAATLYFKNGYCRMEDGCSPDCTIKMGFSSCEKFNGMIDGTVTPIPSKGLLHLGFLLKSFMPLTDLLAKYMRPEPEALEDEHFFEISTKLMFYTITVAIAQIANHDAIGRFSASHIVDGDIYMGIKGACAATVRAKNHHLVTIKKDCGNRRSMMEFCDIHLARDLFDGKVNAVACIGEGTISMGGMISMIDNVNRILDRVALYLA